MIAAARERSRLTSTCRCGRPARLGDREDRPRVRAGDLDFRFRRGQVDAVAAVEEADGAAEADQGAVVGGVGRVGAGVVPAAGEGEVEAVAERRRGARQQHRRVGGGAAGDAGALAGADVADEGLAHLPVDRGAGDVGRAGRAASPPAAALRAPGRRRWAAGRSAACWAGRRRLGAVAAGAGAARSRPASVGGEGREAPRRSGSRPQALAIAGRRRGQLQRAGRRGRRGRWPGRSRGGRRGGRGRGRCRRRRARRSAAARAPRTRLSLRQPQLLPSARSQRDRAAVAQQRGGGAGEAGGDRQDDPLRRRRWRA